MSKFKKLLNRHESATNQRLQKICEKYGASVHVKVRVADVLPIEGSGIDGDLFRYSLQAHFDFTVAERDNPIFAVEFDGPQHSSDEVQRARDRKKLGLCEHFGFPLLRITARYLSTTYRNYDVLTWCVEYWFLARELAEAQEQGYFPEDELVDPLSIIRMPESSARFPMWLSVEPRLKLQQLFEAGLCKDFAPSHWIGVDDMGNCHGIVWICVAKEKWIYVTSAVRAQNFAIDFTELLDTVLTFEVMQRVEQELRGGGLSSSGPVFQEALDAFTSKYKMLSCGGVARDSST